MSTQDTVRRIVGRRSRITRDEMVSILVALDLEPERSTIVGRGADGALYVGGRWLPTTAAPAEQRAAVARAWERACADITCISVWGVERDGGLIRYDQPGGMAPMQHAEIMFVSQDLCGREYDQVGQMRHHCERLLIVRGEPTVDAVEAGAA